MMEMEMEMEMEMWNAIDDLKGDPPSPADIFDPRNPKPSASYLLYLGKSPYSLIPSRRLVRQYGSPFSPNNPKEASGPSSSEMAEEKEYLFYWPDDPNYNPFPDSGLLDKKWPPISLNVHPKDPYPRPEGTDFTCEICGGAHFTSFCSYWNKIPENPHFVFDSTSVFEIVCECSWPIVDNACSGGRCPPNGPRRIAEKYFPLCPPRPPRYGL